MNKWLIGLLSLVGVGGLSYGIYKIATRKKNNNDNTDPAPAPAPETKEGDPAPAEQPEAPAPEAGKTDEKEDK